MAEVTRRMLMGVLLLVLLLVPAALILLVRFFKRPVAAFHRSVTNKIARRVAARIPGFAVITNIGRKSGRIYRTPVNVFRQGDEFLIALTYGQRSDWVANILAARGCEITSRGISYQLVLPVIVQDRSFRRFSIFVRAILRLIDASDYLQLHIRDSQLYAPQKDQPTKNF